MASRATTPMTAEQFLYMDDAGYELLDGELVERNVSRNSSFVGMQIGRVLGNAVVPTRLGRVYGSDLGIQIFANPERIRKADVSFLSRSRVPPGDSGYLRVPPDLVVEVVSPGDRVSDAREKVDEWLGAGVETVWLVYPNAREVHVYSRDAKPVILTADDEITGGAAIPGFTCKVAELFPV